MIPKEKAEDIIFKFYALDLIKHELDGGGGIKDAQQLAIILIDEQINLVQSMYGYYEQADELLYEKVLYLEKVKLAINNYDKRR